MRGRVELAFIPEGGYACHYKKEERNLFQCKEPEVAKHWDGHTDDDVECMLSL